MARAPRPPAAASGSRRNIRRTPSAAAADPTVLREATHAASASWPPSGNPSSSGSNASASGSKTEGIPGATRRRGATR